MRNFILALAIFTLFSTPLISALPFPPAFFDYLQTPAFAGDDPGDDDPGEYEDADDAPDADDASDADSMEDGGIDGSETAESGDGIDGGDGNEGEEGDGDSE